MSGDVFRQLVDAGYSPESVAETVASGDLARLRHTGRFSVRHTGRFSVRLGAVARRKSAARAFLTALAFAWGVVGGIVALGLACYQVAQWGGSDGWGFAFMAVVLSVAFAGGVAWLDRSA